MSQQFESDLLTYSQTTVAEAPASYAVETTMDQQTRETGRPNFLRAAIAAGSMVVVSLGGLVATAESAEATTLNGDVYSPTATSAEKVQDVETIAHRGLKGYYKGRLKVGRIADEDTTRSCLHAISAGADACEIDMQLTKDHVPIVMHDGTTNRVTKNCDLKIATHTWNQLKHCRMNHGDRISTLNNLVGSMSAFGQHKDIIAEIKDKYVSTKELRTINTIFSRYGYGEGSVAYESFYGANLRAMKAVAPNVESLLINGNISNPLRATSVSTAYDGVIIPYAALVNGLQSDPEYAKKWRERNGGTGELITWDTETVSQMKYATNEDVSGFMSNHIGRARELNR